MKRKSRKLLVAGFITITILNIFGLFAQQASVVGYVTDETDNTPLAGATVIIIGTQQGVVTDNYGKYTLTDVTPEAVIEISFVGYQTKQETIDGRSVINVYLATEVKSMEEVLITALGVKREEKALGYSQTNVRGESLNETRSGNWTQTLSGKVAGLSVSGASSGPNASTKITLRGDNSLSPDGNDALIILDGVPIVNKTVGNGYGSYMGSDNAVDFGNRMADINPDDIESVTVLKGPGASALYGSRAANGVLIITTKSGARKEKGIGVTLNSSVYFDDVLHWPDYQFEYGEGSNNAAYYSFGDSEDGASQIATATFGPKFDPTKLYYQYNPNTPDGKPTERTPWVAYPNTHKDFYQTGITYNNAIAIEGGDNNSSARLSFAHIKSDWIIPFTGWQSYSSALSVNHKVSQNLKVTGKVNYTMKDNKNIPMSGYNNHSIAYNMMFRQPNYDNAWFPKENYWVEGLEGIEAKKVGDALTGDNPYFLANEIRNSGIRNSITSSVSALYTFNRRLELLVRSGVDVGNETRKQRRPYRITRYPEGMYREQYINLFEMNTDVLLTYKTIVKSDFGVLATIGGNTMHAKTQGLIADADKLAMPGIYNIANSKDKPMSAPNYLEKRMNSLFSTINLSYKNYFFLDLTGRNDWSSTLPANNNSYFYPSVNLSLALNDMVKLPTAITFLKTRASWAQVGNDAIPYRTRKYYDPSPFAGSLVNPRVLFNDELKPEITSSLEGGVDLRMFRNRFTFDIALYESNTRNQILDIALGDETGYDAATVNAGLVRNRGLELMIGGQPVSAGNFSWRSSLVWSTNKNKVIKLAEGMDYQPISQAQGVAFIRASVGGSTGDIFGYKVQRAPDGQMIYRDGVPLLTATNNEFIGTAHPDWRAGIKNELSYRSIRLGFLFEGQLGGMLYSQTNHKLSQRGRTVNTIPGRDVGYVIGQGVVLNEDGTFSPNTVQVNPQRFYDQYYRRDNAETNTFDASFVKLRELTLDYSFAVNQVNRFGLKNLTIGIFGRNLIMFTNFPAFDPETAQLESGTINIGYESGQLPSTRTMGMSLKVDL